MIWWNMESKRSWLNDRLETFLTELRENIVHHVQGLVGLLTGLVDLALGLAQFIDGILRIIDSTFEQRLNMRPFVRKKTRKNGSHEYLS